MLKLILITEAKNIIINSGSGWCSDSGDIENASINTTNKNNDNDMLNAERERVHSTFKLLRYIQEICPAVYTTKTYSVWTRCMQEMKKEHLLMRMYNENIASSNRILNFMMNHGNTRRNPFRNTIPHTFEIQEFTLPFFRYSDDTINTRPSMEQIVHTTRIFSYDPSEELITTRCPISFEDFNEGDILCEIIRCHHVFKYNHLYDWFSSNSRCPVCRHDINSEVIG